MDNCSSCTTTSPKLFCPDCQASYCTHCAIVKHLSDSIRSHVMTYICEECEEESAVRLCENCDQNLCLECDTRIHNKGKRAQHTKKPLLSTFGLSNVSNLAFITSDFCEQYLGGNNTGADHLKARLLDLLHDMGQKAENEAEKNRVSLIIIEDQADSKETLSPTFLQGLISDAKLKNVVVIKDDLEDTHNPNQGGFMEGNENWNANGPRAFAITSVVKYLDEVNSIFIYDTQRNESLAQLLNRKLELKAKNIFLNFSETEKRSFETSPYIPTDNSNSKSTSSPKIELDVLEDPFVGDDSFARSKPMSYVEDFSRQELGFISFEGIQRPKMQTSEIWGSKENIQPNQKLYDVKKSSIAFIQPLKHVEIQASFNAGDSLQQELMKFAENGELLILKETLLSKIMEVFQLNSLNEANNILIEAENKKLIHTTIRKFLYNSPYYYIGMLLNQLTVESLTWVIKSIKNDSMTPTEKLVLSRIKECYGLKIDQAFWKLVLGHISTKQDLDKSKPKGKNNGSCPLYLRQILDPVTNMETNAIYLTNEDWIPEDQGVVDDTSGEWKTFLAFIEDFFREQPHSYHEAREKPQIAGELIKGSRWCNSVENILNRSAYDNERCLRVTDDIKAIPGGRYGCAQFIKYCGPDNLKELSIGRLTLLVQEAINKGVLRYQRTLLVKNTVNDSVTSLSNRSDFETEVLHSLNNERRAKVLSMVKEALLEILMENADGVSLAQIPFHLKRKLKFAVDFQELGFPKLKNFLSTLKNLVVIQSVGTNHTYVKLKGPIPQQGNFSKNMHSKKRYGDIDNTGFSSNQFFKNTQAIGSNAPQRLENPNVPKPFNIDLRAILGKIELFVKQSPNGITNQDLEMRLYDFFRTQIPFKAFGCNNFYDFLVEYADQIVDIEARKDYYIIYPKTSNLWAKGPLPQNNLMGTRPFMMPPQKYETPGKSMRSGDVSREDSGIQNEDSRPFLQAMEGKVYRNDPRLRTAAMGNEYNFNKNLASGFSHSMNTSTLSTSFSSQQVQNKTASEIFVDSSSIFNISPINYGENLDLMNPFEKRGGGGGVEYNVSNWNFGFNYSGGIGSEFRDQMSSTAPQQTNPKSYNKKAAPQFPKFQGPEESNLEIQESLRFIEELLQDSNEDSSNNRSMGSNYGGNRSNNSNLGFGGFYTPNQSFNRKPLSKNIN